MRFARAVAASLAPWVLGGCGYIHFGRAPAPMPGPSDIAAVAAYTDLSTERKMLKQELALVRRETDALRGALERTAGRDASEVAARLNETSRELATLREAHARLQAERMTAAPAARVAELEAKLEETSRDHARVQQQNTELRTQIDRVRIENGGLAEKLRVATAENEEARKALAQLKLELLALKEAPAAPATVAASPAVPAAPTAQPVSSALSSLQQTKAPPADWSPSVETAPPASANPSAPQASTAPAARSLRTHVIKAGDTLEKLATRYYGAPDRWLSIYEANSAVLGGGQPLRPGMELTIPEPDR